jgi:hypothetical protein
VIVLEREATAAGDASEAAPRADRAYQAARNWVEWTKTRAPKKPKKRAKAKRGQLTISGILTKAADVLVRKGWTTGMEFDEETGEMCLIGAVRYASIGAPRFVIDGTCPDWVGDNGPNFNAAWARIERMVPRDEGGERYDPVDWNDERATKRQVIALLRKAARGR